jgi:hypothetical protein
VEQALLAKGFEREETDHSVFVYCTTRGLRTLVKTRTSHGRGGDDIPVPILSAMRKQLRIEDDEFRRLVECPLKRDEYERILLSRGHIDET